MDSDVGDALTYRLGAGTDAEAFDIDSTSGQLRTKAPLDHEAMSSYLVEVVVEDTQGAADTIEVTISVTDRIERPVAPDAPNVESVVNSDTSLAVRWMAPENTGRPEIESYDLRYRTSKEPWWEILRRTSPARQRRFRD